MSFSKKDVQLFFKDKLTQRILNPSLYKEYSNDISLDLSNYDLNDDDIQRLINIIISTDKLTSLKIRLSDSITEKDTLKKLLRKLSFKKQFKFLSFFIKYLNDDLLSIFLDFLSKINKNVDKFEIKIKYDEIKNESKIMKLILEHMLKNDECNITSLCFRECRFNTEENLNLLDSLIQKNKKKMKNFNLCLKRIFNDIFTPDISLFKKVEITFCNLSSIKYLPIEKLNLSNNNIGVIGIENIIENLQKEACTLKKLNLSNNFLGNNGITKLSECFKINKSLISLNVAENHIFNEGLLNFANNIIYKHNKTLKKLNFKYNSINSDGIIEFCSILKDEPIDRFTKIDFRMNPIDKKAIQDLDFFFSRFKNLSKLYYMNLYANASFENLFFYSKELNNLKQVMFLGYNLPDQAILDLNELLLNNKNIEKFVVSTNRNYEDKGIIDLCPGIKHNSKITHLILPMCYMNDDGAEILANSLFNNICIKEINLEDNKIGVKGIKELSEKVFGKISINKLNLSHNLIDEVGAKYLGQSLLNSVNIKYLLLHSNKLMDNGVKYIADGLLENKSLIELNLDYNKISNSGINYLSKTLINIESLMKLSLSTNQITEINDYFYELFAWVEQIIISDNPLNINEVSKIFKATSNNKLYKKLRFKITDGAFNEQFIENYNLKQLDISFNNKCNDNLMKSILNLKNLSKLNLQHNNLQDKDIQSLVLYHKELNSSLKELLVQNNLIGIEGGKSIAELIKNNKYLKKLNISSNPILSEGINSICDSIINYKNILNEFLINFTDCNDYCLNKIISMILKNKKLSVFSFIGNKFTNKGTDKILSALRLNNSLKKLSLGSKYINSKAFLNLDNYLSFNKTLLFLEIKSSKLGDKVLKKLSKIFKYNHTLIIIYLPDNLLSYEGIIHLGQYLNKNTTINKIKVIFNTQRNEEPLIRSCNPHLVFSD